MIDNDRGDIHPHHKHGFSNTHTYPNQNMYHGSGYLHSKMLVALAGAGAGNTPNADMGSQNWAGGNPISTAYHPLEQEMINRAMKHVGDKTKIQWGKLKAEEPDHVHKMSPVPARKKNKYGV